MRHCLSVMLLLAATAARAQNASSFDAAAAFGARPSVARMSLSPDGQTVAYLSAAPGQGAVLYTLGLEKGARPKPVTRADGKPDRLAGCSWVANDRLVCQVYGVARGTGLDLLPWTRLIAVNADGSNMKAGTDSDPGVYYIFDRKAHQLQTFLVQRDQLEGVKLATVKPIMYPSDDGTMVPAYLTLPPGHEDAKGLPAIVLPHGGPSARDEWGFDWLSQFMLRKSDAFLEAAFGM